MELPIHELPPLLDHRLLRPAGGSVGRGIALEALAILLRRPDDLARGPGLVDGRAAR